MARQVLNLGTPTRGVDMPGGESRYEAFRKTDENFGELYTVTDAITVFGKSLIDDANAAAARTTLALGTAATSAATDFAPASALTTVTVSTKTANHTLALVDAGTVIDMNVATANVVTIPLNATVAFPIASVVEVCQIGAGITTITPASGATLNGGTIGIALRAAYSTASLRKIGTNAWVVAGDTA